MIKVMRLSITVILCVAMLITPVHAEQGGDLSSRINETADGLSAKNGAKGKLLSSGEDFPAGTSVCDWTAIALAVCGSKENYSVYLSDLKEYVESCYEKSGNLDRVKSTPYHRIALTVMALKGDPTSFGIRPDGTPIDLIADGTYAFAGESIGAQGLNGWIYALLTLDASKAEVPQDAKFSREDMIEAIVEAQEIDGGFGLAKGSSDVDITAMALQALAPYKNEYSGVIENGLSYLSGKMSDTCLYTSFGEESVESSAQVLMALCALGIDPDTDQRFVRGNETLLSGIERFRKTDGTYSHTLTDNEGDYLATAQTLLALKALQKLRDGEGWIFDFADHTLPKESRGVVEYVLPIVITTMVAASVVCMVVIRKRKRNGKNNG